MILLKLILIICALQFVSVNGEAKKWNPHKAQSRLESHSGPILVALGDSNTIRWTKNPTIAGYNIVPFAKNGMNTKVSLKSLKKVVWTTRPDACTVMLGTNDAAGSDLGPEQTPSQYENNMVAILGILKRHCGQVILFDILPNEKKIDMSDYRRVLIGLAKREGIAFVDLSAHFTTGFTARDGIHLNRAGIEKFRRVVAKALPLVKQS